MRHLVCMNSSWWSSHCRCTWHCCIRLDHCQGQKCLDSLHEHLWGRSIYYTDKQDTDHHHWHSFGMFTLCAVHSTLLGSDILSYFVKNIQAGCTQRLQHCHPKGCHRLFPIAHSGKFPLVPHMVLILQQAWFVHHDTKLVKAKKYKSWIHFEIKYCLCQNITQA